MIYMIINTTYIHNWHSWDIQCFYKLWLHKNILSVSFIKCLLETTDRRLANPAHSHRHPQFVHFSEPTSIHIASSTQKHTTFIHIIAIKIRNKAIILRIHGVFLRTAKSSVLNPGILHSIKTYIYIDEHSTCTPQPYIEFDHQYHFVWFICPRTRFLNPHQAPFPSLYSPLAKRIACAPPCLLYNVCSIVD